MMNRIVVVFCLIVFLACDEVHKSPKPENIIEKDKMIDIMYDIKLISAARSKNYKKLKDSAVQTDLYIYHKYQIDSITLRQNLDYYATNSFKQFKDMEHRVKLKLEEKKEIVKSEIRKKDSLDKIKEGKLDLQDKKERGGFKSDKNINKKQ